MKATITPASNTIELTPKSDAEERLLIQMVTAGIKLANIRAVACQSIGFQHAMKDANKHAVSIEIGAKS